MNSKQRRNAYRKLPKPGTEMIMHGRNQVLVLGPAVPANVHFGDAEFRRNSIHRVKVGFASGSTASPRIKTLSIAA